MFGCSDAQKRKFVMSAAGLAAADELHDFVAVAGLDGGCGPLWARQNLEIALNGYAAGRQGENAEQVGNRCAGRYIAVLAVHGDLNFVGHMPESSLSLARGICTMAGFSWRVNRRSASLPSSGRAEGGPYGWIVVGFAGVRVVCAGLARSGDSRFGAKRETQLPAHCTVNGFDH